MVEFLIPQEQYLEAGAHIGTRQKHGSMRGYIYKARDDGLHVLDLKKLDERLRMAGTVVSKFPMAEVFVIGNKDNARKPINKFCEMTGATALVGRFTPGRFTNPAREDFCEPRLIIVTDPSVDRQSVREAFSVHVPVIAFCDTNNATHYLDLVIPTNNKGRKSIALMYWLLAREVMKATGAISGNDGYTATPQDFEA